MSQSRLAWCLKWVERRFWKLLLASFVVGETYAIVVQQRDAPENHLASLDAQGLSEKAAFSTASAWIWRCTGIYPPTPRRYWARPVLAAFMLWLTLHLVLMVPGPCEKEVIDYVRARYVRRT